MVRYVCRAIAIVCAQEIASPTHQHFLKRGLFFFTCWCNQNEVYLDSRVHIAIKPSHINGGQHGQESEEGEEGEVRSEEDCEEDPQGRQEEEVRHRLMDLPAIFAGAVIRAPESPLCGV